MDKWNDNTIVEIPLSSEYLDEDGMYVAGYLWGRHVRSPKSAPTGAPVAFLKGVDDGYGDAMTRIHDVMDVVQKRGVDKLNEKDKRKGREKRPQ